MASSVSTATNASSSYDRHIMMTPGGNLQFGVWNGSANVLETSAAYNDGGWHHVVATLGPNGQQLFVDGALVGTLPNTSAQGYDGYWRLGSDNTWGGSSTNDFSGSLDEFAVYSSVLPAATVRQHYELGSGTTPPNAPPISAPIRAERQRLFAGRSDRSGECPSRVWITNMPVERAWASMAAAPGSPARVSPMS